MCISLQKRGKTRDIFRQIYIQTRAHTCKVPVVLLDFASLNADMGAKSMEEACVHIAEARYQKAHTHTPKHAIFNIRRIFTHTHTPAYFSNHIFALSIDASCRRFYSYRTSTRGSMRRMNLSVSV